MLNIFLQFQVDPSNGSLVIAGEKTSQTDGQTDRQDRNIYASSLLGGGINIIIFNILHFGTQRQNKKKPGTVL